MINLIETNADRVGEWVRRIRELPDWFVDDVCEEMWKVFLGGTMSNPRYILAKYVPDLARMEPRNIGVIVWSKGAFAHRFCDSTDAASLGVNEPDTYDRWTTYWTRLLSEKEIRPRRGKPVNANDPACIDAIMSTQKGNYILVDAGEVMQKIRKAELPKVADYLFNELVATREHRERESRATFQESCKKFGLKGEL